MMPLSRAPGMGPLSPGHAPLQMARGRMRLGPGPLRLETARSRSRAKISGPSLEQPLECSATGNKRAVYRRFSTRRAIRPSNGQGRSCICKNHEPTPKQGIERLMTKRANRYAAASLQFNLTHSRRADERFSLAFCLAFIDLAHYGLKTELRAEVHKSGRTGRPP